MQAVEGGCGGGGWVGHRRVLRPQPPAQSTLHAGCRPGLAPRAARSRPLDKPDPGPEWRCVADVCCGAARAVSLRASARAGRVPALAHLLQHTCTALRRLSVACYNLEIPWPNVDPLGAAYLLSAAAQMTSLRDLTCSYLMPPPCLPAGLERLVVEYVAFQELDVAQMLIYASRLPLLAVLELRCSAGPFVLPRASLQWVRLPSLKVLLLEAPVTSADEPELLDLSWLGDAQRDFAVTLRFRESWDEATSESWARLVRSLQHQGRALKRQDMLELDASYSGLLEPEQQALSALRMNCFCITVPVQALVHLPSAASTYIVFHTHTTDSREAGQPAPVASVSWACLTTRPGRFRITCYADGQDTDSDEEEAAASIPRLHVVGCPGLDKLPGGQAWRLQISAEFAGVVGLPGCVKARKGWYTVRNQVAVELGW